MSENLPDINEVIIEGIETKINVLQSFFSNAQNIVIETRPESKTNQKTWLMLVYSDIDDQPLSMLVMLDTDEEHSNKSARSMAVFLTAFGFEVSLQEGHDIDFSNEEELQIAEIFDFMTKHSELSTFVLEDNEVWSVFAYAGTDQVRLFSIFSDSKASIMFAEKCLGLFLSSKDRTVTLTEGTTLNMYGCVSYAQNPDKEDE